MKRFLISAVLVAFMFVVSCVNQPADPVQIRFMWPDQGKEGVVMRDLLDRFETENPDIKVVMDIVEPQTISEQLQNQIKAGKGPDIARITGMSGMACHYLDLRPYLKDAQYFEDNFHPATLQVSRCKDDTRALHGFPLQFIVIGPYINRTLFKQAGIEVPSDVKENVTWEEWTEVTKKVAEATGTKYAIAIDRSGQRFAGPAMSSGASFFDADGNWTIDTEGFRRFAHIVKGWHDEGITPKEIWLDGLDYAQAAKYFINAELVMYMTGSWNIPRFTKDIGDTFDWDVVPNPTGPGGSTGLAGGACIAAFNGTKHPEEVARVMEYLIQEDVVSEFSARTLNIPAQLAVAKKGVKYVTDLPAANSSLNSYLSEIPKLQSQGFQMTYSPIAHDYFYGPCVDNLTPWIIGELSLDEAIQRIQQALDEAAANL